MLSCRKIRRTLLVAAFASTALAGGALASEDTATFEASATTQAAISVACSADLRFGTIGVHSGNAAATITVSTSDDAATSSSDADAYPAASDSGRGVCAVTNETGGDATASLAGGGGTFAGTTLSGVSLAFGAETPLSADIELSKAAGITDETIFIGGTVTIPANHTTYGTYAETITITVTD